MYKIQWNQKNMKKFFCINLRRGPCTFYYVNRLSRPTFEFQFEYGTGYKLASQTFSEENENYLQLDAIFMPVQKVDFKIENDDLKTSHVLFEKRPIVDFHRGNEREEHGFHTI